MAGLHAFWPRWFGCVGVALYIAALCGSAAIGQQPQGEMPSYAEPLPAYDGQVLYDGQGQTYARYDEPPAPPFDYWNPTWMPCQSLRTNRSLVLGHLWFGMDILGWSTKGVHAPPLVTSSDLASGGIIGQGNTRILFGDEWIQNELRPGGRLTIGWWFDPNQYSGIEWHYFELDGQNIDFNAASTTGNSFLGRPITDAVTGNPAAVPIANADLTGSIRVRLNMQLTSTGILFRDLLWAGPFARVDYLVGYRHAHLFDRFRTDESLTSLNSNSGFAADSRIRAVDQFRTVNQFDGADLGLKGWWSPTGKLAFTSVAKIAVGASNNNVLINGFTTVRDGGTSTTTSGAVLTQPSNIGRRAQQEFGIVSEIACGLEWQPICFWKFNLGYTWFYWSEVARAIDQIDTNVDVTQSCACPGFRMHTTSFWAQGLNAGFSYQF